MSELKLIPGVQSYDAWKTSYPPHYDREPAELAVEEASTESLAAAVAEDFGLPLEGFIPGEDSEWRETLLWWCRKREIDWVRQWCE